MELTEVPVVEFGSADDLDILEAVVEGNRQRAKTNEQIGREFATLKVVYHERENRQGASLFDGRTTGETSDNHLSEVLRSSKPSRRAAARVGVSHVTANRAEAVVEALRVDSIKAGLGEDIQEAAAEIVLRATRRIGELTTEIPTSNGQRTDRTRGNVATGAPPKKKVLADARINEREAQRCEQIAAGAPSHRRPPLIARTPAPAAWARARPH